MAIRKRSTNAAPPKPPKSVVAAGDSARTVPPESRKKVVVPVDSTIAAQSGTPMAVIAPVESKTTRPRKAPKKAAAPVETTADPAKPYPITTPNGEQVSIVHLVAELAPFARTGGLGEAVANLALQQVRSGQNTSIIMPLYRQVRSVVDDFVPATEEFSVVVGSRREQAQLFESASLRARVSEGKPRVYFLANSYYFDRDGIYGDSAGDYGDSARRWSHFSLAAITALPQVTKAPVMLHAHDWHAALAPAYHRTYNTERDFYRKTWTTLTVHNGGFQGHFPAATMADVGLPWEFYNHHMFEWHGRMNFLKGGSACADVVTTVSPTHAHELRTAAGGFGLHEHFIAMRERFVGILNGIDTVDWNPASDPHIEANYSLRNLSGKRKNKAALQRLFGLPERTGMPVIGMSARMVSQKGLDLILGSPRFLSLDAQYIFLGQGEQRYVEILNELAHRAPERIGVQTRFTAKQEHQLLAGADMIVMPSQYEPCGLTQMRAQRYGALPVARKVGGLADTIEDNVTGFLFDEYTQADFIAACARAIDHYRHPQTWTAMLREAMTRDFGWDRSESRYRDLYRRAIASPRWRR